MKLSYELLLPQRIVYGAGSMLQIGTIAKDWGKKALLVSDPLMKKIGVVERCLQYLTEAGIESVAYCGIDSEPTDNHVNEVLEQCRQAQCDVIIALGGGSCIDAAKAAAILMTNEGKLADYTPLGGKSLQHDSLPLIAIPTTAGTGSEVTKVTVIIDTKTQVKMMISQPQLLPKVALVDAELSMSCPPSVIASSGVDALCHAIEAYISKRSQPITDGWALQAIELLYHHLPLIFSQQGKIADFEKVALGAMLAGAAFSNASVTLVHGMSRPIGALYHVPHGISNAMLLPAVLEYIASKSYERLIDICPVIIGDSSEDDEQQRIHHMLDAIKALCKLLGITSLSDYGIEREAFMESIPKMASDAIDSGSPSNCPFEVTKQDIEQLYQICYDYR